MSFESNSWRVSQNIGNFKATLAGCRIEGHSQFIFRGRNGDFNFDAQEAAFLHRALGGIMGALKVPVQSHEDAMPSTAIKIGSPGTSSAYSPSNAGRRWSEGDDTALKKAFAANKTIRELSDMLYRSPAAIVSRLLKHDLVEVVRKPEHVM